MKYLTHIATVASSAALVLSLGSPAALDALAYAATAGAGSSASAAASSTGSASSGEASGEGSASSAESDSGEDAAEPSGAQSSAAESAGADAAEDAGSGSAAKASKKSEKAEKSKESSEASGKKSATSAKDEKAGKGKSKASKDKSKAAKDKDESSSDEPEASGEDPEKYAKKLAGLSSRLEAVPDEFGKAKDVAHEYKLKLAKLEKRRKALEKEQQRAQNVLDEMQDELSAGADVTLAMVLTGRADFDSIDSRAYLLSKVADGSSRRIGQIRGELSKLAKRKKALEKREKAEVKAALKEHSAATEASIAKGNALAAKIEKNVSLMRYAEPKSTKAHAALRKTALAVAADWYEFEDAMAGNDGVLTFGTGADFDMGEKAFVKKWGDAIDAFYAEHYPDAPLKGQGATMAKAAWEHKIDPRLCAAVSIVESTGGQYCIKPHNAWGWGAADSDPYGGASSWGSWSDAIEAWHEGLASSTTGLATAPTVEELGEIYCSSLDWAAKVAEGMQQISAEAE